MMTPPNINYKEENDTVLKEQVTKLKRQIPISRSCFYHHEYKYDSKINLIYLDKSLKMWNYEADVD